MRDRLRQRRVRAALGQGRREPRTQGRPPGRDRDKARRQQIPGRRRQVVLALSQEQVDHDQPGAGRGKLVDRSGQGRARRRPRAELGHGGIVGQDQHDLATGRLGPAQAKAPVQRLKLEGCEHVAVAVPGIDREDDEGDDQGREQPRPQARAVARPWRHRLRAWCGQWHPGGVRHPRSPAPWAARRARHRCPRRGAARRRPLPERAR